jgi:hypothetical protein
MDYHLAIDSIAFARDHTDNVTIGGGEPTMHPRFFDILGHSLRDFDSVWMATNGSNTNAMYRLSNIIDQCDYESFKREDYCSCECNCDEDEDDCECLDDCYCEPSGLIYQEDKLSVALSTDGYHDPIDDKIRDLWERQSNRHSHSHFELRDVSHSISATGRAKVTGVGWSDHCVCSGHIIKPNGEVRACGCPRSPVIGHVLYGMNHLYDELQQQDWYIDSQCGIKRKRVT